MLNARQIVSLIAPAIFLIFSASFLVAWLVDRERKHILLFSIALVLYGVAAVSQILGIPSDAGLNALMSAASYTISSSFLVEGILRRIGRRYHPLFHLAFLLAVVGGIYFYYYVDRSLITRIYILNFGIGGLFLATAVRMHSLRSGRLPDRILFWLFLAFSVQFFGRTILTLGWDPIIARGGKEAAAVFGETLFWLALQVSLSVFGAALAVSLLATAISDVLEDLKLQRDTDPLTGLVNRRGFDAKASEVLLDLNNAPVSAIVFDIDHFKNINDAFGHDAGDEVLRRVGRIVARSLRQNDIGGRVGGEEFVVLSRKSDRHDAFGFAERLRTTLENEKFDRLRGRKVTASFGIAVRREGESLSKLLARADRLLYTAKANGRNRSCWDLSSAPDDTLTGMAEVNTNADSGQVIFLDKRQSLGKSGET